MVLANLTVTVMREDRPTDPYRHDKYILYISDHFVCLILVTNGVKGPNTDTKYEAYPKKKKT